MSDKNIVFPERGRVCFAAATCVLQRLKSRGTGVIFVVAEAEATTHTDSRVLARALKARPTTTFVLKNRRNPRPLSAHRIQLVLENRHPPPHCLCGCVPWESGSQEKGIR